jgi:hypothetical protein
MAKPSRLFTAGCIGCALLIASPSWAATVVPTQGDLTINQGQGFKPLKSGMNANVGDSVMVGPGGAATVVYEDGCKVNVQPGAVVTVAPLSPCASGSYAADMAVKALPAGAPVQPESTFLDPGAYAFWAIWAGGVGFIAYEISQIHGQAHPASP